MGAGFVWLMEDVLDLYALPYDGRYQLVYFDECPYQLVSEVRQRLPAQPGRPQRYDYEYKRQGTCNLFMFFAPYECGRHVKVTDQRTKVDFMHCMQALADCYFPEVEVIQVVCDNLNTHTSVRAFQ